MDFLIGGVAAMGATFFSNPLDVLKTRIQLQGELKPRGQHAIYYRNAFNAAVVIVQKEGIFALQKGLHAALGKYGIRSSMKLGIYQWLSDKGYICNAQNQTIFYKSFLASAVGGGIGSFLEMPLSIATTQLQAQAAGEIAVGHQHRHSGLVQALRRTYEKGGIRGLWRGTSANIVRTVVGSSAQLTSFAQVKDVLQKYEMFRQSTVLTAFVSSSAGAMCQTIFQTPFDLVQTRLNNQDIDEKGKGALYEGMYNCFSKTWQSEGLRGFYKGVLVNYTRIGRQTVLTLVFWEILKDYEIKYMGRDVEGTCRDILDEATKSSS